MHVRVCRVKLLFLSNSVGTISVSAVKWLTITGAVPLHVRCLSFVDAHLSEDIAHRLDRFATNQQGK